MAFTRGTILRGLDIGLKDNYRKYIWYPCEKCNKERWVKIDKEGKPENKICRKCLHISITGKGSPCWKGGRYISISGYVLIKLNLTNPFYSMANGDGYIREHRFIMATHLNRFLNNNEIVHHINGIKDDNRIENLEIKSQENHPTTYTQGYREGFRDGFKAGRGEK